LKDWSEFLKPTDTEGSDLLKVKDREGWTVESRVKFLKHQLNLLLRDLRKENTDIALERLTTFEETFDDLRSDVVALDDLNPYTPIDK